jgi:hypothetical protein
VDADPSHIKQKLDSIIMYISLDLHGRSLFCKVCMKHSRSSYTVEVLYPRLIHDNRAVELCTVLSIVSDEVMFRTSNIEATSEQ